MRIKAVGYARYSSDKQREESIHHQVDKITEFAREHGLDLIGIYADEAKTGTNTERENLKKLLKDSEKGEFQYVIIYKTDRLSRNVSDALNIRRKLSINKVQVISVLENFDDETPEGGFFSHISMAMSEFYVNNLRRSVMVGLRQNAEKAIHTGGIPPLGFDVNKDLEYIVNDEEAEIVRYIFESVLDGKSYPYIARELNNRGLKNKIGEPFKPKFTEMLRNTKYIGEYVYNRRQAKRADGTRNNQEQKNEIEIIRIPDAIPQIVNKHVFKRVQTILDRRRVGKTNTVASGRYLLTGISKCGICNRNVFGHRSLSGPNDREYIQTTYACNNLGGSHLKHTNSEKIHDFLIRYLKNTILNVRKKGRLFNIVSKEYNKLEIVMSNDIGKYNRRIEQLGSEVKDLIVQQNSTSKSLEELYSYRVNEKMMMINDIRMNRDLINSNLNNTEILNKKFLYEIQDSLREEFLSKEKRPSDLRLVIHKLVNQVVFNNDKIKIILNLEHFMNDYLSIPLLYEVEVNRDLIVWEHRYNVEYDNKYQINGELKEKWKKQKNNDKLR